MYRALCDDDHVTVSILRPDTYCKQDLICGRTLFKAIKPLQSTAIFTIMEPRLTRSNLQLIRRRRNSLSDHRLLRSMPEGLLPRNPPRPPTCRSSVEQPGQVDPSSQPLPTHRAMLLNRTSWKTPKCDGESVRNYRVENPQGLAKYKRL